MTGFRLFPVLLVPASRVRLRRSVGAEGGIVHEAVQ